MNFFWFGASWVAGDELYHQVSKSEIKSHTFAAIVSRHFEANCINLGDLGSSLDDLPYKFHRILPNIKPRDSIFFCLPANHRVSFFDDHGQLRRILPSPVYENHNPHAHSAQWYRYFDCPQQRIYNQDKVTNLLYLWCHYLQVNCYFANVDTVQGKSFMSVIPDKNWLTDRDYCLAAIILPIVGPNDLYLSDGPELTEEQWQTQKQAIDQYVAPNYAHPNLDGHKKIAEYLINRLDAAL